MVAEQERNSRPPAPWAPPGERPAGETVGLQLSPDRIEAYLDKLEQGGYTPVTLQCYRRHLTCLYQFLPEEKRIQAGTLAAWQGALLEAGYSVSTVNTCTTAANGFLLFCGYGGFQAERLAEAEETIQPELTRAEYLRLLSTARALGRERHYLLVKVFGSTGLSVGDLEHLTAEAVRAGRIVLPAETLRIPGGLREELLRFMEAETITAGPLFLTRGGRPQSRTAVTGTIKTLARDAQVPEEKATPRCLRKLYLSTINGILENLSLLAEQAYDRMLEKEQRAIGWDREP